MITFYGSRFIDDCLPVEGSEVNIAGLSQPAVVNGDGMYIFGSDGKKVGVASWGKREGGREREWRDYETSAVASTCTCIQCTTWYMYICTCMQHVHVHVGAGDSDPVRRWSHDPSMEMGKGRKGRKT